MAVQLSPEAAWGLQLRPEQPSFPVRAPPGQDVQLQYHLQQGPVGSESREKGSHEEGELHEACQPFQKEERRRRKKEEKEKEEQK